jgi:poly(3-hydroxybutyrate) depolymerase
MKNQRWRKGLALYVLGAAAQMASAQNVSVQHSLFRQQEAELVITGGTLKGKLFTPTAIKRPPVVLIIAGSGQPAAGRKK